MITSSERIRLREMADRLPMNMARVRACRVHANVHDHFNLDRHLIDRETYKERRSGALAEWQILASQAAAAKGRRASGGERFASD